MVWVRLAFGWGRNDNDQADAIRFKTQMADFETRLAELTEAVSVIRRSDAPVGSEGNQVAPEPT